jgi:long-chain acyl-CoA synthetase
MKPGLLFTWPAKVHPNRIAIVFEGKRLTYQQADARSNRVANGLNCLPGKKGDRVAVLLTNSIEAAEVVICIAKSNSAMVTINARHTPQEHAYVINDSEAETVIFGEEFWDIIEETRTEARGIKHLVCVGRKGPGVRDYEEWLSEQSSSEPPEEVSPDDFERIVYTSGTTGRPKGAVSTYQIFQARLRNLLANLDEAIHPEDVNLNVGPLTHAAGLVMNAYYMKGAMNIILRRFDPELVLKTIQEEKATHLLLIPTMIVMLVNHPGIRKYDLSSLKGIYYGTSPMSAEKLREAIALFGRIFRQNYGLSEAPQPICVLRTEDHIVDGTEEEVRRLASAGRPVLGVEVRVVGENGEDVPPGEIGEILIRSDTLMKEYWKLPEATAEALRGGYLHTGDMATVDERGYIYIVDRKHNMIISGGYNIYPREVEETINKHPSVLDAAVIGIPDEVWGESVRAFVVLKEGQKATEEEIIEICRRNLASYKKPKSVEFVHELPRNPYGKILYNALKEKYWKGIGRKVN